MRPNTQRALELGAAGLMGGLMALGGLALTKSWDHRDDFRDRGEQVEYDLGYGDNVGLNAFCAEVWPDLDHQDPGQRNTLWGYSYTGSGLWFDDEAKPFGFSEYEDGAICVFPRG